MSTEITPKNQITIAIDGDLSETQISKITQWGRFGLVIHNSELSFQARAQSIIAKLKNPVTIEEVAEAEAKMKSVKQELAILSTDRKNITSRFDAVATRLMASEKSVDPAIKTVEQSCITLKKQKAEADAKVQKKADEAKWIREQFLNTITRMDGEYRERISNQVAKAYTYALGKGNITLEGLPEYLTLVKGAEKFGEFFFTYDMPKLTISHNSTDDVLAIWKEIDPTIKAGAEYVKDYHRAIDDQFAFYSAGLKNKEAAAKLATDNAASKSDEIKKDVASTETANKLESLAVTITTPAVTDLKPLKHSYEIDMEETDANAILIMATFVANFELCKPGVRVKSIFALSIGQMGMALMWAKNKNESLEFKGINFKKVDKL